DRRGEVVAGHAAAVAAVEHPPLRGPGRGRGSPRRTASRVAAGQLTRHVQGQTTPCLTQASSGVPFLDVRSAIFAAARLVVAGVAVIGGVLAAVRIADYTERGGLKESPSFVSAGHAGQLILPQRIPVHHPIPLSWYPPGA